MDGNLSYRKEINRTALPLILSSVTGVLMGMVDQAFVGHISVYAYAGVGLIFSCINSLVGVLGAFSIVFNIMGSQARGNDDRDALNEKFSTMLILSALVGAFLFLFFNLCCDPLLRVVFGLTGETLREAGRYLRIFSLTIPLNLLLFIYNSVFKIFRSTGHIFVTTLFANGINILLDYVLIFGKFGFPRMGTEGAAVGTVIALVLNLAIYIYMGRRYVRFSFRIQRLFGKLRDTAVFSLPFLGQEAMEDIVFVFSINMLVARMGAVELSAYNLMTQITSIIQMPMFGYAAAAVSLASEAYGGQNYGEIRKIRRQTKGMLAIWFAAMFAVILLNGQRIVSFISEDGQVLKLSLACLPLALGIQIVNYGINIEKSILQSVGKSVYTLTATFFVNFVIAGVIWILVSNVAQVYEIMGAGYLLLYGILYGKSRKMIIQGQKKGNILPLL